MYNNSPNNTVTNVKRHVGKIINTDQRCVVVFMQIPGREDHALVVPTDTLQPRFEQALMEVLESSEGQAEEVLANALSRRLLPETGQTVLAAMHLNDLLIPVPVANIVMLPRPNMPFPLTQILQGMGRQIPKGQASLAETEKFNPHAENQQVSSKEEKTGIANNLLREAADLEAVAKQKRDLAYQYAPNLAPKKNATVEATIGTKEVPVVVAKAAKVRKPRVAKVKAQ